MPSVKALLVGVDVDVSVDLEGVGVVVDHVGSTDEVPERLAGASNAQFSATDAADVDAADTGAVDTDDRQDPVHCVVGHVDGPGDPAFELPGVVHEFDGSLPVVLFGDEPLSAVAADVLAADAETYVEVGGAGGSGADDGDYSALATAIEDAATTYRQRLDRTRTHTDLPDAGFVVREGVIAAASQDLEAVFGVEEAVDRSPAELVAPDDREAIGAALASADATTQELRIAPAIDGRRTVELRLRRSPADGAVVGRARDVTDEANERSRLSEAAEQLDSLLQHVPMSIYFKDHLGRHERVSDFITHNDPRNYIMNDEGKVHPHPDDVVGKTDFDLYSPGFAEKTYADDMEVVEEEEHVVSRIESGTTSLGEDHFTSTTKVPRYDENDEVIGLVGVTVDVTERVTHRKELERQNERLNEFAEVLTHDLRNPLNIANGYLDLLEEGYDEQAIDETSDALERMESLIEEIRAFVLEGRLVEEPEAVDLRAAAQEAWSTVETAEATLEIDGDLELRADASRLRRLLENLFRNALEHGTPADPTDAGDPLAIRVVAGHNEFVVEDDGVGIPEDLVEDVFERGYTSDEDGTGFGLAIVKNIAEAHGWTVVAEASQRGGARFVFSDVVRAQRDLGRTIA
ncbi:hypothetical protein GCM10028857_14250 [Salinarchaeum chitinilyticum]